MWLALKYWLYWYKYIDKYWFKLVLRESSLLVVWFDFSLVNWFVSVAFFEIDSIQLMTQSAFPTIGSIQLITEEGLKLLYSESIPDSTFRTCHDSTLSFHDSCSFPSQSRVVYKSDACGCQMLIVRHNEKAELIFSKINNWERCMLISQLEKAHMSRIPFGLNKLINLDLLDCTAQFMCWCRQLQL